MEKNVLFILLTQYVEICSKNNQKVFIFFYKIELMFL